MTNTKTSLLSSVAVKNLLITVEGAADEPAVWFDILVDDKLVVRTLEWIGEDGDVCEYTGRNALSWPHDFKCVAAALGLEESDVGDADFDALHDAIIQRLAEALEQLRTPPAPEGDHNADLNQLLQDYSADKIDVMDDARASAAEAEAEEDERLRLDYSNALISLDDITVAGSTTADVQKAFDELMTAAFENPLAQDVIREAKEVLEGTQWQLDDDCARIVTVAPVEEDEKDDAELAAGLDRLATFHTDFQKSSDSEFYGDAYLKLDGICEGVSQKPVVLGFGDDDDDHAEIAKWLRELQSQASGQLWSRIVEDGKIVFCDADSGEFSVKYPVSTYLDERPRQMAA